MSEAIDALWTATANTPTSSAELLRRDVTEVVVAVIGTAAFLGFALSLQEWSCDLAACGCLGTFAIILVVAILALLSDTAWGVYQMNQRAVRIE